MTQAPLSQEEEKLAENWFRGFLIADIIFSVLLIIGTESPSEPEPVSDPDALLVLLALVVLVALIASWIGLFLYKHWARQIYLVLSVLGILFTLSEGISIADLIGGGISLVILIMAYGVLGHKFT